VKVATLGVSYSDHYQEKGAFQQLMERLRKVLAYDFALS
jgi:hypothetical protein